MAKDTFLFCELKYFYCYSYFYITLDSEHAVTPFQSKYCRFQVRASLRACHLCTRKMCCVSPRHALSLPSDPTCFRRQVPYLLDRNSFYLDNLSTDFKNVASYCTISATIPRRNALLWVDHHFMSTGKLL